MAVIRLPLPMASAAAAALVLLAVSTRPLPATAHGYLSKPISRNYLTSEEFNPGGSLGVPNEPCISCLLRGGGYGQRTSPFVYPETVEGALGHGLCGDGATATSASDPCWTGGDCPAQDHMPGGRYYIPGDGKGAMVHPNNVYEEGQHIEVEMVIIAHHLGWIEMRLCDEERVTEECLQKYPLQRVRGPGEDESMVPINPNHPSLWYLPPMCADEEAGDYDYDSSNYYHRDRVYTATYKLPEGVTCETCVVQWWWVVGQGSCVPPGYDGFEELPGVDSPGFCAPGTFPDGWYDSYGVTDTVCGGEDHKVRQEFWNCADIRITPRAAAETDPTVTDPQSSRRRARALLRE